MPSSSPIPCVYPALDALEGNDSPVKSTKYWIGLGLAISSSVFIGSSFIIKKKGLLRISRDSTQRAGSGGYGYLKEPLWWVGLITMGIGEGANFASFGLIPAVLVTTLGALSVIVSAILASCILNEQLNIHGKIGCLLCILGSTVVVINAPPEKNITTLDEIGENILDPVFIIYCSIVVGLGVYLMYFVAPVHGTKNILVYIAICSLLGSLTVMSCKGVSIGIILTFHGNNQLLKPLFWFLLIAMVTNITIQMNYLNKALDIFNTAIVTPIYYVMFTTLTTTASAILFKDWMDVSLSEVIASLCGFFVIIIAVFLLNAFREMNITLEDIRNSVQVYRRTPSAVKCEDNGHVDLGRGEP